MESVRKVPAIDARMQAALARLTANEKVCLRRRLQQQTAKEMALELGVSPHAVEKRLKMARAKLGLSSSLEAARLLSAAEGYQFTGPHASDLSSPPPGADKRFHQPLILGGLVMIPVAAAVVAFAAQSLGVGVAPGLDRPSGVAIPSLPADETKPDNFRMAPASDFVDGTPEELRAFAEDTFREMDKDGSGFVERGEAPVPQIRLTNSTWNGSGSPPREWYEQQPSQPVPLRPDMARGAWIARGDANEDGKLSFDEYLTIRESGFDSKQVPIRWREQREARR
jgi:DNA-binding CsgD family transcriptional regulator